MARRRWRIDFTRAVRSEGGYRWLVAVPHRWRRQLSIKGRRLLASQLVDVMRANGLSAEVAAAEFDVPVGAVFEALDYCARNAELVKAEAAEERRLVEPFLSR